MPILATGNNSPSQNGASAEAGFSLTELLAVLAILSLMVGAVVLNLPAQRSDVDRESEAMAVRLTQFVQDGSQQGSVRAIGVDADGMTLFQHNGLEWVVSEEMDWPDDARIQLEEDGERADLPERRLPRFLFEPYGAVPDMTLVLQASEAEYRLSPDPQGRIIRTVER